MAIIDARRSGSMPYPLAAHRPAMPHIPAEHEQTDSQPFSQPKPLNRGVDCHLVP
jgi:hypothetical protein